MKKVREGTAYRAIVERFKLLLQLPKDMISKLTVVAKVTIYGALSQSLMVLILFLISKEVSSRELGSYGLSIAISVSLYNFLDFGDEAYCYREIAAGRMHWNDFQARFRNKILICSPLLLIVLALSRTYSIFNELWIAILFMTILQLIESSLHGLLRAKNGLTVSSKVELYKRIFQILILSTTITASDIGLKQILILYVITQCFGVLLASIAIKSVLRSFQEANGPISAQQRPWRGSSGFAQMSLLRLFSSLDQYLISGLFGISSFGIYFVLRRLLMPSGLLFTAGSQVLFPEFAQSVSARRDYWIQNLKVWPVHALTVGWILLIIIEAPNAAKIFVDNPNAEVVSLLRWLALANLLQMLTSNFGILLQATLRESVVARFTAISYLVYMFLLSFFGLGNWKIGYIGISLFISQIILLIAYVFKYGRRGLKL